MFKVKKDANNYTLHTFRSAWNAMGFTLPVIWRNREKILNYMKRNIGNDRYANDSFINVQAA